MNAESKIVGDLSQISLHVDIKNTIGPENFQNDIDKVFKKSWLVIGRDFDIPEVGDYRRREIPGLNLDLLVVRDKEGKVRVFHNACRHRGNQLACAAAGRSPQGFSCAYHGWTYNIDGTLRAMTDRSQFPDYPKEALGLKEVRSEVRHTMIFICLDDDVMSLDEWLEALAPKNLYEGFFTNFRSTGHHSVRVKANWNMCMDAFSESYHTAYVHKYTAPDFLGSEDNPNRHPPAMEIMQRHARHSAAPNPEHIYGEGEKIAYKYTAPAFPSFDCNSEGCPPGMNFGDIEFWAYDIIKFFPNFVMLTGRDWYTEGFAWPISENETLYEWNTFLRNPKTYGERVAQEFPYIVGREIVAEDMNMIERQQVAHESGSVTEYWLSFQEIIVAQQYATRRRMLALGGEGETHE